MLVTGPRVALCAVCDVIIAMFIVTEWTIDRVVLAERVTTIGAHRHVVWADCVRTLRAVLDMVLAKMVTAMVTRRYVVRAMIAITM